MDTLERTSRAAAAAGLALIGVLSGGCAGQVTGAPTGEVRLALSLPDGTSVSSVTWQVLSATNAVVVSGALATNGSQRPSFIASLAPAVGDTVNMSATTSAGVTCAGTSVAFDVIAGRAVSVAVDLECGAIAVDGGVGTVVVSGTIVPGDHCPVLTTWLISPQAAGAADPIDVTVAASDEDSGDVLSYAWAATAGTFSNAASATTQYHCGPVGAQTLTVQVSDDHAPVPCTSSISFPSVDCL
jgi:hypothetical protein